jgi:hypothetical protein
MDSDPADEEMDSDSVGEILVPNSTDASTIDVDPEDTAAPAAESSAAAGEVNDPDSEAMRHATAALLDTYFKLDRGGTFTTEEAIVCLGFALKELDARVTVIVNSVPRSTPGGDRFPLFGEWDRLRAQMTEDILGTLESL